MSLTECRILVKDLKKGMERMIKEGNFSENAQILWAEMTEKESEYGNGAVVYPPGTLIFGILDTQNGEEREGEWIVVPGVIGKY